MVSKHSLVLHCACFRLQDLNVIEKMARAGYHLPTPLSVIAADFDTKGQRLGPKIKSANLSFWDDQTCLHGRTRYILFDYKYERIGPLLHIAKIVAGGVNRAAIAAIATRSHLVEAACGKKSESTIKGGNQNAKVPPCSLLPAR